MKHNLVRNFTISVICVFLLTAVKSYSLNVAEDEVKKSKEFEFINNTSIPQKSDSSEDILAIGAQLAKQAKKKGKGNVGGRYRLLRAIDKKNKEKLSADIFIIEKGAGVDHIKNIRRMLAGYLIESYKYEKKEATVLAKFITYYNGFYRSNMEFFQEQYSPIVLKNIKKSNAGLSKSYKNWPGKSRIIIPLSETDRPDPTKIADKDVTEDVRKKKTDKGLKDREEITKIKEKEVKREEKKITEDRRKVDDKKKRLEEEKKQLEEDKKKITDIKDPEERKRKEEELKKREEELKKKEAKTTEDDKKVTESEKKIDEKKSQIEDDKKTIASDKNPETPAEKEKRLEKKEEDLKKKEEAAKNNNPQEGIFSGKLYYLKVRDFSTEGMYRNDMYIIDPKARKLKVKSPYENITGKKFDVFDNGVVVIGRSQAPKFNSAEHNLVLLHPESLKPLIVGQDPIFWRSFIEVRENEIYAIVSEKDGYFLAKFDKNLKLLGKSAQKIHEDSFISFYEDIIYINNADKNVCILKKADLQLVEVLTQ